MRVGIATDHGGFPLKEEITAKLNLAGHEVVDFGAHTLNPDDDYPDFVVPLAESVASGKLDRGVAICGSGVGATVTPGRALYNKYIAGAHRAPLQAVTPTCRGGL